MPDPYVPVRTPGYVEADVDGERVLLSPDFSYFGLAGSGACVWDLIDGQRNVDQIVAELADTFDASDEQIRVETAEFIDALLASGFLEAPEA